MGIFLDKKGYKRYKGSGKPVHRHVAERKIGRKLKPWENVHHKNRNKLDNRRSNLRVMHKKHHKNSHMYSKKKSGWW
jgi:hypothetical protein